MSFFPYVLICHGEKTSELILSHLSVPSVDLMFRLTHLFLYVENIGL